MFFGVALLFVARKPEWPWPGILIPPGLQVPGQDPGVPLAGFSALCPPTTAKQLTPLSGVPPAALPGTLPCQPPVSELSALNPAAIPSYSTHVSLSYGKMPALAAADKMCFTPTQRPVLYFTLEFKNGRLAQCKWHPNISIGIPDPCAMAAVQPMNAHPPVPHILRPASLRYAPLPYF